MRVLFIIGVLLISLSSKGQVYFNNSYDLNGGVNFTTSVVEYNNGYYFVSRSRIDSIPSINITKLDYNGDVLFTKRYFFPQFTFNLGAPHCLDVMADNDLIFCGQTIDSLNNTDCFIMKFDLNGDTIWTKGLGGAGFDVGDAVFALPDTSFILLCNTSSYGSGGTDFWRLHLDVSGNILDSDFYGGGGDEDTYGGDLTNDGGTIISGMINNTTPYIIKTDASGNQEWDQSYPYGDGYCFISQWPSGGYIMATRKVTSTDGSQACLIKTDADGVVIWQKLYGASGDEYAFCKPIILADGSIVIGGGVNPITPTPGPSYVLKTDSMGNQIWLRTYTLSVVTDNYLYDIKATSDGGFIFAGATFVNTQDSWIVKLDSLGCEVFGCDGVGFHESNNENLSLILFPNPSTDGAVTVQWPSSLNAQTLALFDATGKKIREEKLSIGQTTTQLTEDLSTGLYLVRLEYPGGVLTEKYLVR